MNIDEKQLFRLIKRYITCANYLCNVLKDEFQINDESLLDAYRQKKIKKEGKLLDFNITFSFHGGGCYFEFEGGTIDIDFGPNGRCDGFDSFRLFDFVETNKLLESKVFDPYILEQELKKLYEEGIILRPRLYPNPDLYYLNENVNCRLSEF
jgi:hypothetical protein